MIDPVPAPRARARRGGRFLRSPMTWALLLLVAAAPWALSGAGMEFIPFLLMLVGGWLCGFAFVGLTFRVSPPRRGLILHTVGAVASAAMVVVAVEFGGALLSSAPETVRALFLIVQMASIPAAGWIWILLVGRGVDALGKGSARRAAVPPQWERNEHGDGSLVRFTAVPLRMRTVSQGIVLVAVIVGAGGAVLLVAFGDYILNLGPRLVVIVVGMVVALPVYLLFTALLKHRSLACTLGFGRDTLRIEVGGTTHNIPIRDIESLTWRPRSDYARVEVRAPRVDLSLVVGLARPAPGIAAELPELPRRVFRMMELAGFSMTRSGGSQLVAFRRGKEMRGAGQRSKRATTAR